ncbi:hypothetical protein Hanom_Chr02g00109621 [Helianthus anomalus]
MVSKPTPELDLLKVESAGKNRTMTPVLLQHVLYTFILGYWILSLLTIRYWPMSLSTITLTPTTLNLTLCVLCHSG